jgi:hypothetical protein
MVGSSPAILPRMVHRFAGRKPGLLSAVFEVPQSTGTLHVPRDASVGGWVGNLFCDVAVQLRHGSKSYVFALL